LLTEKRAARKASSYIDCLLSGRRAEIGDDPLLAAAQRLHEIGRRLPPAPVALEERVQALVEPVLRPERPDKLKADLPSMGRAARAGRRLGPALAGAAVATCVLLAVWLLVPGGQQVVARMKEALLGQTRLELTPQIGQETPSVRTPLRDLVAVELIMGRAPSLPTVLPEGATLIEITAVSYPDLPPWISQPLYVELCYGTRQGAPDLCLRQYRLLLREGGQISGVQVAGDAVVDFEAVDVGGVSGTLLTWSGKGDRAGAEVHTVLWERDGLLLELESDSLSVEELLAVASSVRQ
jgi:hypothetical protein